MINAICYDGCLKDIEAKIILKQAETLMKIDEKLGEYILIEDKKIDEIIKD